MAHNELFKTAKEEQYFFLNETLDQIDWSEVQLFKDVYEFYEGECIARSIRPIARNNIGPVLKDFSSRYGLRKGNNNRTFIEKFQ